jgi:hypothetical protein
MTPENFCYWLQGYFEINAVYLTQGLDAAQTEMIREHLQLVFQKLTSSKGLKPDTTVDLYKKMYGPTTTIKSPMKGEYITTCGVSQESNCAANTLVLPLNTIGPPDEDGYQKVYYQQPANSC